MAGRLFISTGELSADIHAARLIEHLLAKDPNLKIFANGGDNMQKAGAKLLHHIDNLSFMGFAEVIKHLPFIKKIFNETLKFIDENKIDLVVLVDYPGFNLRLAKALKKRKLKVVYYICPQIWAWHQSRVKQVRRNVDKVICILPFEPEWYTKHGVDAVYGGNPLMDKEIFKGETPITGLAPEDRFIGLFPGSRKQELENHLDVMIASAIKIRKKHPSLKFVIGMAPGQDFREYRAKYRYDWLKWVRGQNDAIIQQAEYLIMVSGTASLEAALLGTPMVIIYKTSFFTYYLAKLVAKIDFIGLANLIAGREGIHELIQKEVTPENIYQEVQAYLSSPTEKERFRNFYKEVQEKIGPAGASGKAAGIILSELQTL
ncbi:MAG: lipid-A-disaccharide synthase [Fidelibacterota bacterium]